MEAMQFMPVLMWIALALAAIVGLKALFKITMIKKQNNSNVESHQLNIDSGQRAREEAHERMKSDTVVDPATELERTMLIDAIERKFQQEGGQMPESIRTMLSALTVDEIKESVGDML